MPKKILLLSGLFLLSAPLVNLFAEDNKITDETILKAFGKSDESRKSHEVMAAQQNRLHEIFDGFLNGDTEKINSSAEKLSGAMQSVALNFPSSPEKETEAWKAMAEIVNQSHAMREATVKNDYQKAFGHFMLLSNQCIRCHQAVREQGKLPEPAPETAEAAPKKEAPSPKTLPSANQKKSVP